MICTFGIGDKVPIPQNKIWEKRKDGSLVLIYRNYFSWRKIDF